MLWVLKKVSSLLTWGISNVFQSWVSCEDFLAYSSLAVFLPAIMQLNYATNNSKGSSCRFLDLLLCVIFFCLVCYPANSISLSLPELPFLSPQIQWDHCGLRVFPLPENVTSFKSRIIIRFIWYLFLLSGITVLCFLFSNIWKKLLCLFCLVF